MTTIRLAKTAMDAEILRRKFQALRGVRRIALLVVGMAFGLFGLVALQFAAFFVLHLDAGITPAWSAVIVAGANLGILLVLVILSAIGGAGALEIEARMTRDRSLTEMRSSLALATLTGPAARLASRGAMTVARRVFSRRR